MGTRSDGTMQETGLGSRRTPAVPWVQGDATVRQQRSGDLSQWRGGPCKEIFRAVFPRSHRDDSLLSCRGLSVIYS